MFTFSRTRSLSQVVVALATAGMFTACSDYTTAKPFAPGSASATLSAAEVQAASDGRLPELGSCQNLRVAEGSKVTFHVFGIGVQIYRWSGTKWEFVAPSANLYADAAGNGLVGTHFGGPTWRTLSGSTVVGTVAENGRCTPDVNSIPWLLLNATASGSGVFENTTLIQRLNTVGGNAPATPGTVIGQEVSVGYTADYYFYRTQ